MQTTEPELTAPPQSPGPVATPIHAYIAAARSAMTLVATLAAGVLNSTLGPTFVGTYQISHATSMA